MVEVNKLEVKRCFVVSQLIRRQNFKNYFTLVFLFLFRKGYMKDVSLEDFNERLKKAKERVLKMKESELDKVIKTEWKKRLITYDNSDWYLAEISPNEAGVWRRAGELPLDWTNGSLSETAEKVKYFFNTKPESFTSRAKYTIQNMLKTNVDKLQNEKYLFPIMFQGGSGTRGRKRLKRQMKYDIDDGCMRSVALTINGAKSIKAYIGFPKK